MTDQPEQPDRTRAPHSRPSLTQKRTARPSGVDSGASRANRASASGPSGREVKVPTAPLLVTGAALIVALVAMIFWNISLRNDVGTLEQQIESIRGENSSLRESANATVYQLLPTENAPANAHAQAWFSIQGSGVLSVANLPPLGDGTVYQFWYVTDSPTNPVPGGTFTVDDNGQGFMLIPPDVDGVTSIAISLEPEGGSASPTGAILLTSDVSDARG